MLRFYIFLIKAFKLILRDCFHLLLYGFYNSTFHLLVLQKLLTFIPGIYINFKHELAKSSFISNCFTLVLTSVDIILNNF